MDINKKYHFSSFIFIKADDKYKYLLKNERIAVNEELANMVISLEDEIFLRTYILKGLNSKADLLLWLSADTLENVQDAFAKISITGAGKYFKVSKTLCGWNEAPSVDEKGNYKYMHLQSFKSDNYQQDEETVSDKIKTNKFLSYGLFGKDIIITRQANNPEELAASPVKIKRESTALCRGMDLIEILSKLG